MMPASVLERRAASRHRASSGLAAALGGEPEDVAHAIAKALPEVLVRQVLEHVRFPYQVASTDGHSEATLWSRGGPRHVLRGHRAHVAGVEFFPLGDKLLTWGDDPGAIIWDTASGQVLQELRHVGHPGAVVSCARVFPAGDRVVTCGSADSVGLVWDVGTGRLLSALGGGESVRHVEVGPAGDRVLTVMEHSAILWDAGTAEAHCRFQHDGQSRFSSAVISPHGDRAASASNQRRAFIWSVTTCAVEHELIHSNAVMDIVFFGDGGRVATSSIDGTVRVWGVASGKVVREMERPRSWPQPPLHLLRPAQSDSDRLVGYNIGGLLLWNMTSGELRHRIGSGHQWASLGRTDGAILATGGDILLDCRNFDGKNEVNVRSAASGQRLLTLEKAASDLGGRRPCTMAVGVGAAFDPEGFGRGFSLRQLP